MLSRLEPLLLLAIVAGYAYPLSWVLALPPAAAIAVKGAGVGLLALAALVRGGGVDGRLLALYLAFGALGDMLLEVAFLAGVAAFALGHLVAIRLFHRNRRSDPTPRDFILAVALLIFGLIMPLLILRGQEGLTGFMLYSLLLSGMAAAAWLSCFPRRLTGLGALLFVASDALIAVRMGPAGEGLAIDLAIWLLYFSGQLLIFLGVSRGLRG